ncbi:hypothetical protein PRIPAC_78161 [Pristionchus pacificus]|uniref:G protein-coupled receptor n=1 Tax=Pristionchus pacificus TaxID=54126 RepID=A0A2A6CLY1_PRIPA|nr:hypothetical protein PRIPAC_78161 [Pristionchus pacificus]|eukprot:PDM79063.1 G protein-coupled receptor [Pristionchus pacificus]
MADSCLQPILLAHWCASFCSISFNLLLTFIIYRHTPATFAKFGIMIKYHALADLLIATGGAATMQRVIATGWSVIFISYGPCVHFGSDFCYGMYTIALGGEAMQLYSLHASFAFRLLVIEGATPSKRTAFALIACVGMPVPIPYTLAFFVSRTDDAAVRLALNESLPEYLPYSHDVVTGISEVHHTAGIFTLLASVLLIWPAYLAIFVLRRAFLSSRYAIWLNYRSKILASLARQSGTLSEKSKRMHRTFVSMLPFTLTISASTLILGLLNILRDPALESSSMMSTLHQVIITVHACVSLTSIFFNLLLTFIIYRYTPANFSTFGIMIKWHAMADMFTALGGAAGMQRLILHGWSVYLISYGPCTFISSGLCYVSFTMEITGDSMQLYALLASFAFRLLVIEGKRTSRKTAFLIILCVGMPVPLPYAVSFYISRDDDETMRRMLNEILPEYLPYEHVVTDLELKRILFNLSSEEEIEKLKLKREEESLQFQICMENPGLTQAPMLTAQAMLPCILSISVATVIIGFLGIARDPALESSSMMFGDTMSMCSPIIVLALVDHYRSFVHVSPTRHRGQDAIHKDGTCTDRMNCNACSSPVLHKFDMNAVAVAFLVSKDDDAIMRRLLVEHLLYSHVVTGFTFHEHKANEL